LGLDCLFLVLAVKVLPLKIGLIVFFDDLQVYSFNGKNLQMQGFHNLALF
jgi:hypothetical protein